MRHYGMFDGFLSVALIVAMWVAFFVCIGFMARLATSLFCLGYGC